MRAIGIDFDGVIHRYSKGWADGSIYDPPVDGAIDTIHELQRTFAVFVFTTRDPAQVVPWLTQHGIPAVLDEEPGRTFWNDTDHVLVTQRKLAALAYIDDRAIRFESWPQARHSLNAVIGGNATPATEPAGRNDASMSLEISEVGPDHPEYPAARVELPTNQAIIGMVDSAWYARELMRRAGNSDALVQPDGDQQGMYDPETGEDWRDRVLQHFLAPIMHRDRYGPDDPESWRLAFACLTAREGTVDPPEVLAELIARVDGLDDRERTLHTIIDRFQEDIRALTAEVKHLKQASGGSGA